MLIVLKNKLRNYLSICDQIASINQYTNVYGLGRSLIALSLLLTLCLNAPQTLFNEADFIARQRISAIPNLFLVFDYSNLIFAYLLSITILIVVISGYYPKISGVLHWFVTFSYFHATTLPEGGDQIASNITFLLIFITVLDKRRNHWDAVKTANYYSNFTARLIFALIAIQISVLYLHSAFEKIYKVEEWVDGSALYYWFNNTIFGLNSLYMTLFSPIIKTPILLFSLNWMIIIFEMLLATAFLINDKRKIKIMYYGIIFHLMIALMFGLVSFFITMSGCLVLFLYPKSENLKIPTKLKSKLLDWKARFKKP